MRVALSTRPSDRVGEDALWDQSEAALARALGAVGLAYEVHAGEGAFYGPKIEFTLIDRAGRAWQCGTIQFDFHMPRAFAVVYVDRAGVRRAPVMLHRALFGSVERFLGVLLEQHGGRLPLWLAPTQVSLLPLAQAHQGVAVELAEELRRAGIRGVVDDEGSLGRRIRRSHDRGIPLQVIFGDRELRRGEVTIRGDGEQVSLPRASLAQWLASRCRAPAQLDAEGR